MSLVVSVALAAKWGLPEGWALVVPFAALAVRAFLVGRRPARAALIGLVELAMFGLVAVAAWLAWSTGRTVETNVVWHRRRRRCAPAHRSES